MHKEKLSYKEAAKDTKCNFYKIIKLLVGKKIKITELIL